MKEGNAFIINAYPKAKVSSYLKGRGIGRTHFKLPLFLDFSRIAREMPFKLLSKCCSEGEGKGKGSCYPFCIPETTTTLEAWRHAG